MSSVSVTFHGELNDFLPAKRRSQAIPYNFEGRVSVKDVVESLGVPHPEVAALTANGRPVDFSYLVAENDVVEAYGLFTPPPADALLLIPPYPGPARFVLDTHLGQLANYLRMLGFDTLYRNDYPDEELAQVSSSQTRILLTRDLGLLKRSLVVFGYFVRQTDPKQQVVEILRRYALRDQIKPLQRCIRCNGQLRSATKEELADRLEERTRRLYDDFSVCLDCGQIYWKGSHYENMLQFIDGVLNPPAPENPH